MLRAFAIVFVSALSAGGAAAQEVCATVPLKNPAPTLSEIYATAEKDAKAWKPDVVVAQIGNTALGPLNPKGGSEAWNLVFFSKSANANVSITTFRGTYRCFAIPGAAGRLPDLKPDFFRDGAKLYELAKQHGATFVAEGYNVSIQTAAAPTTRHATWYISYQKENQPNGPTVIIDANTGVLEKILK
jgi:hypothetical protein